MSVFASNPFAALGDDGDVAPAPKPAPKAAAPSPAPSAPKAAAPAKQDRAPRSNNNNRRAQGPREINADVPAPGEDAKEDRAKNFARSGGRGGRGGARAPGGNPRGNAGTYQGGNRPRRENGGGRPFDRQSQTGRVDSEKAEAAGWGADEGKKELEAEVLAEGDAKEEQAEAATGTATPVREAPVEEEDNTQTYEQYLAAQAEKKLNIASLPEARKANEGVDDAQWGNATAVTKKADAEEEWLMGAPKTASNKTKAKKEKIFLEIDAPIRKPTENSRGGRGGRGGARGGREGGRGRGQARGGNNNNNNSRGPRQSAPAVSDASAFPALA
ncbi:Stm1p [Sporobolomyces salmoneus]|uniref:Stm1p n=1 Tax=Sporobolomyces salmoneus TaxID=183962 RepID=UPI0031754E48